MYADKELAAGLAQALLNNARDLAADATQRLPSHGQDG
jgi:hypothetical protein